MCLCPNYALYIETKDKDKPNYLKFINIRPFDNYRSLRERYGDSLMTLPCGQCEQCRRDYATTWAVRCALEAEDYNNNWFITLTYDDYHYRDLNKDDIQEFLNNLNPDHKEVWFKYWLAGEYGPTTKRAHYHMILINYDIQGEPYSVSEYGNAIYKSKLIEKAWGKGYVQIQEAGDGAMAYVAKYASKTAREHKFSPMMSKGIGLKKLIDKQDFINKYGYIQGKNGKRYKIPRYYFKKIITEASADLKERRKKKAKAKTAEHARKRHLEHYLTEQARIAAAQKGRRSKV